MSVNKIVITSDQFPGWKMKIPDIVKKIAEKGYLVTVIPEVEGDTTQARLKKQIKNEEEALRKAGADPERKQLIICIRGTMDLKALMTEEEFQKAAGAAGISELELRDSYDAVFCIAKEQDETFPVWWIGNPHLRVTEVSDKEDAWMDALESEILFFLGDPVPLEIERKYLIEYPDLEALKTDSFCRKVEIEQIYLEDEEGNFRIRRRGEKGDNICYLTRKKQISPVTRVEVEERISEDAYETLKEKTPRPLQMIAKDRYCILYLNRYFEIDVFPFWKDKALMEIELKGENEEVILPPKFKVIREVTEEKEYRNKSIAAMLAGSENMTI